MALGDIRDFLAICADHHALKQTGCASRLDGIGNHRLAGELADVLARNPFRAARAGMIAIFAILR